MTSLASYYTKAQTRGNWQSRVVIGKNGGQGRAGRGRADSRVRVCTCMGGVENR